MSNIPHRNLCEMFRRQAERLGPRTALRYKQHGLYCDLSWASYRRMVYAGAHAWISLGIRQGDRVSILSENRYEWLVADLSILAAGAADVSLHAPLTAPQVAYQLADSGARWVVASTDEQLAKVLEVREQLPELEGVVALDPVARLGADPAEQLATKKLRFLSWPGFLTRGRQAAPTVADEQRGLEERLGPDDLAALIYTSGTTGEPKGVMLTHENLLSNAVATYQALPPEADDVLLSWLPYSHIYARLCDHYLSILAGCTVALAEGFDSLKRNLLEVQPTHMTGVPRFYEKVWEDVVKQAPADQPRRLREILGRRMRWMSAGGAPLPPHVAEGFHRCGIPLLQGYGLTESSPVITFNTLAAHKIGTVGRAIAGVEVKIAEDGEILTHGPHVMKGYWRKPQATAEAIDCDGWLHTGDIGELDADGFLTITGRKKDLIVTSAGKNIAPALIESLLVADEFIDQAVVFGDRRKFLSALVVPNFTLLEQQARRMGIDAADRQTLVRHPAIYKFFDERVAVQLASVSSPERVKRFVLLDRAFTLADDELTATMKVRRQVIIRRYQSELDALYEDAEKMSEED